MASRKRRHRPWGHAAVLAALAALSSCQGAPGLHLTLTEVPAGVTRVSVEAQWRSSSTASTTTSTVTQDVAAGAGVVTVFIRRPDGVVCSGRFSASANGTPSGRVLGSASVDVSGPDSNCHPTATVVMKQQGYCSATPGECETGAVTNDNQRVDCGATRMWFCEGVNGGGAVTCITTNAACVYIEPYTVTTLAGTSQGYQDGPATSAKFDTPRDLAIDAHGDLYIADTGNHRIRRLASTGVVTTIAGGTRGAADGTGAAAQFDEPRGIAVDAQGNLYVADARNSRIRKVSPAGVVTTLAGSDSGHVDGDSTHAKFQFPVGVDVGTDGMVYVGDPYDCSVRKVTAAGDVSTVEGARGSLYSCYAYDGAREVARFGGPLGVAVGDGGTLYVADGNSVYCQIRVVSPDGAVTTLAGGDRVCDYSDGTGSVARFANPTGVALDARGNVYVGDASNNRIRKVTPAGAVTTLAGSTRGYADGTGSAAQFWGPAGVAVSPSGDVYVADAYNHLIRKLTPTQR